MRETARKPSGRLRAVGVLGELILTAGILVLLFVAWELWYTNLSAARTSAAVTQNIQAQFAREAAQDSAGDASGNASGTAGSSDAAARPADQAPATVLHLQGQTFGVLYVPKFGKQWSRPITDGVGSEVLNELGVGHYPSTAMPGEVGNFAVAAHRQTHGQAFWDIDKLTDGDRIYVQTDQGYYTYRWTRTDVVSPQASEVLAAVPYEPGQQASKKVLTMTTCHPPYSTEMRMVAFAELESWQPLSAGAPAAIAETGEASLSASAGGG